MQYANKRVILRGLCGGLLVLRLRLDHIQYVHNMHIARARGTEPEHGHSEPALSRRALVKSLGIKSSFK